LHQGDLAQQIAKCIQDKEENKKLQEQYTTKVVKPQYDSKQVSVCMQMKSQQDDAPKDDLSRFAVQQKAPAETIVVQESQASGVSETAGPVEQPQLKQAKVS